MPAVAEVFAGHVLNEEVDMASRKPVQQAAKIYLKATKATVVKHCILVRDSPPEISATQIFPEHIFCFLPNWFEDSTLLQAGRQCSILRWSAKWCVKF